MPGESFQSLVVVVVQPASWASVWMLFPPCRPCVPAPVLLLPCGVGQPVCKGSGEVESLSDVRRPDARRAAILRPEGVTLSFHVSVYKVEPVKAVLRRDLLAKDVARAADADEVMPVRP